VLPAAGAAGVGFGVGVGLGAGVTLGWLEGLLDGLIDGFGLDLVVDAAVWLDVAERVTSDWVMPLAGAEAGAVGDAVTVAVTVTVGTGDASNASRGSVRGGCTTTPTRSSALKSTYGLTDPVCTSPASGWVAETTLPTCTPATNGVWSVEPRVTKPSPGLTRALGSISSRLMSAFWRPLTTAVWPSASCTPTWNCGSIANSTVDVAEANGTGFVMANNTVADLVQSLARLKTNTRDIISILRAVKAAGALHAELIVQ